MIYTVSYMWVSPILCNDVMWTIYVLVLMSMVWCWYDDDDDDHE